MNHHPTFSDEAVELLAKRLYDEKCITLNLARGWETASDRTQRSYWAKAKQHLDALTPFLVQGRDCERCKGSGTELYQGCGEWLSEECPDCEGSGIEQPHPAPLSEQDREKLKKIAHSAETGYISREHAAFLRDLAERGEGR